MLNKKKTPSLLHTYMSKFKDFLKMNEAGYGDMYQLPNAQSVQTQNTFAGWHNQNQMENNPILKSLTKIGELMTTICNAAKDPHPNPDGPMAKLGILPINVSGNPQQGGFIANIDKRALLSSSVGSYGSLLNVNDYQNGIDQKVLKEIGGKVTLDMKALYQALGTQHKQAHNSGQVAQAADNAVNSLATGLAAPGNGAITLARHQYN